VSTSGVTGATVPITVLYAAAAYDDCWTLSSGVATYHYNSAFALFTNTLQPPFCWGLSTATTKAITLITGTYAYAFTMIPTVVALNLTSTSTKILLSGQQANFNSVT